MNLRNRNMIFSIGQSPEFLLEKRIEVLRPKIVTKKVVVTPKQQIAQVSQTPTVKAGVSNDIDWESPVGYAIRISWNENLVNGLRLFCEKAVNQKHCLWVGMGISKAEWNWREGAHGYFWLMWSKDKSTENRVWRYNKYWYKAQDWFFFYGDKWRLATSRYCTSEVSSNSSVWCPNWKNNFNSFWIPYKNKFL